MEQEGGTTGYPSPRFCPRSMVGPLTFHGIFILWWGLCLIGGLSHGNPSIVR